MLSLNKIITFLWILLSWGLLVVSRLDPILNQLVLKGLIPLIFVLIIIIDRKQIMLNKSLLIYIVFTLWASLSVFYTVNIDTTLTYLQQLLGNILIWYCTYRITYYIRNKRLFFVILGSAFLLHALFGVFTPIEVIEKAGYGRAHGIYINANALGFAMWYGIIITLFFMIDRSKTSKNIFYISIISVFVWVLLSTGSRKSTFALLISGSVFLFYTARKNTKKFLIIIPFIVIFLGVYSEFFREYIINNTAVGARLDFNNLERGTATRSGLIGEGLTFFTDNPVLGIGLGSFKDYSSSGLMSHNDYIEVLSSTGIIGFAIYILIYVIYFKESRVLIRVKSTYNYGVISMVFLLGFLFLGMGRPAFLDPMAILMLASFQGHLNNDFLLLMNKIHLNNIKEKKYDSLPNNEHARLG